MTKKIRNGWQLGLRIAPKESFQCLRKCIQKTPALAKLSKRAELGFARAFLRCRIYVALLFRPMPPLGKQKPMITVQLVLLHVPQVKR